MKYLAINRNNNQDAANYLRNCYSDLTVSFADYKVSLLQLMVILLRLGKIARKCLSQKMQNARALNVIGFLYFYKMLIVRNKSTYKK